jgi:hypothetical protein
MQNHKLMVFWVAVSAGVAGVAIAAYGCSGDATGTPTGQMTPASSAPTGTGNPSVVAGAKSGQAAQSAAGHSGVGAAATSGAPAVAPAGGTIAAGSGGTGQAGMATTAPGAGTTGSLAGTTAPSAGMTGTAGAAGGPTPDSCDRACLIAVMQGYLDALIAKDPSKLVVASSLKYTENGVVTKLGETLWKTASSLMPNARLDFADPVEGQVTTQVVVQENGSTPVLYMARLKVVKHEITEIEAMSVRRADAANGFFNAMKLVPEPVFLQPIDPSKRMTREQLKAVTELYLDYLEGKKGGSDVPFDTGCKRYENGQVTASGLSSFNSQSWGFEVTHRILVIDEEAGITWGMFPFMQSASGLVVGEAFKVIEGKIMMIQAVMAYMPAKAWD